MTESTNLQSLSIRGKVAYLLSIAESIFSVINDSSNGSIQARVGLNKCWEWLSGNSIVSGDDIYYFLANEDDTGLDVYSYELDENDLKFLNWEVIIHTIGYVAWQAYNLDKEKYVPQDIEKVDDTTIDNIFEYLNQIPSFNKEYALNLRDQLLAKFPFDPDNKFGSFISKEQV
jgi:hypothetical protein